MPNFNYVSRPIVRHMLNKLAELDLKCLLFKEDCDLVYRDIQIVPLQSVKHRNFSPKAICLKKLWKIDEVELKWKLTLNVNCKGADPQVV